MSNSVVDTCLYSPKCSHCAASVAASDPLLEIDHNCETCLRREEHYFRYLPATISEPLKTNFQGRPLSDYQAPGHPPQVDFGNGRSTKGPDLHLIPTLALVQLAERFTLGEERKGDKAWNANSSNQEVLVNKPFILERISHVISHAMKLRDSVVSGVFSADNDASAISWAGAFLCCAVDAIKKQAAEKSSSAVEAYLLDKLSVRPDIISTIKGKTIKFSATDLKELRDCYDGKGVALPRKPIEQLAFEKFIELSIAEDLQPKQYPTEWKDCFAKVKLSWRDVVNAVLREASTDTPGSQAFLAFVAYNNILPYGSKWKPLSAIAKNIWEQVAIPIKEHNASTQAPIPTEPTTISSGTTEQSSPGGTTGDGCGRPSVVSEGGVVGSALLSACKSSDGFVGFPINSFVFDCANIDVPIRITNVSYNKTFYINGEPFHRSEFYHGIRSGVAPAEQIGKSVPTDSPVVRNSVGG